MKGRMRVAMLIQDYLPIIGGAQRQLAMAAPLLAQSGIDVHILTRRYPSLPAYERMDGIPVYRLPSMGSKPVASLIFTLTSLLKLRELKPDLIHAYNFFSPLTTALLFRQMESTPVIVKVLRGGVLGDVHRLSRRAAGWWRIDRIRRNVDAFIAISSEIDAELDHLGIEPKRRHFIPNGVDADRFIPLEATRKRELRLKMALPDGPLVIFTGRLADEKRVIQLAEIWPAVHREHPLANLILLGDGPERERLLGFRTPGVHVVGRMGNVCPYLQAADLFVLPSITEGLSNAMLEAMATGLPVLVTRVGGAGDVIAHQQNGWLIPPDQPERMQEAMVHLLSHPEQRSQLGQAARRTVEERYALGKVCQQLCDLYDAVLSRPLAVQPQDHLVEKLAGDP